MEPGRYCEFGAVGEGRKERAFSGSPLSLNGRHQSCSSSIGDGTSSMAISLDMDLESIISSMDLTSNPSSDYSRRVSSPWYNERCYDLWGPSLCGKFDLQESSLSSYSSPSTNFDIRSRSTSMNSSSYDIVRYDPIIEIPSCNPRLEEDDELISECFNHPVLDKLDDERKISSTSAFSRNDSSIWNPPSSSSMTSSRASVKQEEILESVWSSLMEQTSAIENKNVKIKAFGEASNSPEPQEQTAGILNKIQYQLENFKPFFAEGSRVLSQAGYYHTGRKFEDLLEKTAELKDKVGSVAADIFQMNHSQHTVPGNVYSNGNGNYQATQSSDINGTTIKRRRRFPPSRQQKPAHRPKYT